MTCPALTLLAHAQFRLGAIAEARALCQRIESTPYRHPAYADLVQLVANHAELANRKYTGANKMPVNVTPPAGTTAGTVDTDPITPTGANANIVFQFADGSDNKWKFTGFSIKATGNQPPTADFFQVTNNLPNKTMTVKDKNGDGKLYSFA